MRAGKHVVTANKQLLSHHGEELWGVAREHGVQLRFEASVAGVVPVIRVLQESLAGAHVDRIHGIVNGTTNYILSEMARIHCSYADALADAQRLGYAEADPSDDVNGKDAAAKMAILARLAFDTPVHIDQVTFEGIEHITSDDMEYAEELGLGLKLIGTAERIDGKLAVRVHPAFLYEGHPLASVHGPFNAITVESEAITEITMSGPGAGGPQTASAVLGDVISAMIPPASTPETTQALEIVDDVEVGVLPAHGGRGPAGRARVRRPDPRPHGASIKSVVQKGLGERARLVMVVHPLLESRFFAAVAEISRARLPALPAARDPRHRGAVRLAQAAGRRDPLAREAEDRGEPVEVMVVVQDAEPALRRGGRDERVGEGYAVRARGALRSQLTDSSDRRVCDRAGHRCLA